MIASRYYDGYTLHFQGGRCAMPIQDLEDFIKFWNS